TLLYNDAYAHLMIARRVFDNTTPGLAQLGGVWLPLPHVVMLPFVWNDTLWRSGLAGSIPSMLCYVSAANFVFLSVRRITHDSRVSSIGALAFMLNPGVLYIQSTPLTEPLLIATMTAACYFFLAWVQDDQPRWLVWAGLSTFLATLARYDGWFLLFVFLGCIVVIGVMQRRRLRQIVDHLLLFGALGAFGPALWLLWNQLIFHDALYFQNGPYSSQTQQMLVLQHGDLDTYHNVWQAFRHFLFASAETVGPMLLVLAILGLVMLLVRKRLSPEAIATLPFAAPFAFYVVALFTGQAVLYVPGASPAHAGSIFYNARYGTEIVAPVAFFLATLIGRQVWLRVGAILVIAVQSFLIAQGGIIALQDGQYGASCVAARPSVDYLAQHYLSGNILEDTYFKNPQQYAIVAGTKLTNIIYQGSGAQWDAALQDPAANADWVVIHSGDLVAQHVDVTSAAFLAHFTPVAHDSDGVALYHRTGAPLAQHTLPADFDTAQQRCGTVGQ
ncbi:MAG: glycosyltransferase family 39 protein, partial [Ktedonobacterales bacterium]|nr:glycosyltransferase family 39 protein [Ktedonobacterales bacterium]